MTPQINLSPESNQPKPDPAVAHQPQAVEVAHQAVAHLPPAPRTGQPTVAQPAPARPADSAGSSPSQPAPAPQPPSAEAGPDPIIAQIVQDIPVHAPGQAARAPANPFMPAPTAITHSQPEDDDLDKILQAVNSRVKVPQSPAGKKTILPAPKVKLPFGNFKGLLGRSRPVGVLAITTLVGLALIILAVLAYRSPHKSVAYQPGKVGTSSASSDAIQQAGGTLVRPSDLDDYSNGLQTKLNSLNDSQDFDSQSLSNQNLGL